MIGRFVLVGCTFLCTTVYSSDGDGPGSVLTGVRMTSGPNSAVIPSAALPSGVRVTIRRIGITQSSQTKPGTSEFPFWMPKQVRLPWEIAPPRFDITVIHKRPASSGTFTARRPERSPLPVPPDVGAQFEPSFASEGELPGQGPLEDEIHRPRDRQ